MTEAGVLAGVALAVSNPGFAKIKTAVPVCLPFSSKVFSVKVRMLPSPPSERLPRMTFDLRFR